MFFSPQHTPTTYQREYIVDVCCEQIYICWVYVVDNKVKTTNVLHNLCYSMFRSPVYGIKGPEDPVIYPIMIDQRT